MSESRLPQFIVAVTYPESFNIDAFESVCRKEDFFFSWILHDKDKDKEGNLKKPHYHLFIDFKSQQIRISMLERLGILENQYQRCRNAYGALKYLMHSE